MDLKQDNKNSFIENILELITHDVDSSFLATFRMKNKKLFVAFCKKWMQFTLYRTSFYHLYHQTFV